MSEKDGISTSDDIDTRQKYKEFQGTQPTPKIKVDKHVNKQRQITTRSK